jgi:single-strand DNA-binding protein
MSSVNKVILVGNLTRDPELRHTSNKKAVCVIGLATNRSWTDENGEKHEEPEYHRLVAWDKLAETCHQYLRKGRKIYAEGRLQTRSYTEQDSVEKYATEIVLDRMEMLDAMPQDVKETLNGTAVQHVQ